MYTMTTTADRSLDMVSLFDYLGQPAGSRLGTAVWEAAKTANIKPEQREVSTKRYTGKVLLYPKYFLENYFNINKDQKPF